MTFIMASSLRILTIALINLPIQISILLMGIIMPNYMAVSLPEMDST